MGDVIRNLEDQHFDSDGGLADIGTKVASYGIKF